MTHAAEASPAPTTHPWLAPALAALASADEATAERVLLAALPVQAARVTRDVAYLLELPETGRHLVRVGAGGDVTVARDDGHAGEFRLAGSAAALAPLAAGAPPRRLPDVTVGGRRRRLRRLLRALGTPVGLPELLAAGAHPHPSDLLALLVCGVPAEAVRGSSFTIAYVVAGAAGERSRTLVRAEADGRLTTIPEAPGAQEADATVTVDPAGLLGVLAGSVVVAPEGDAAAVATLHGWLRRVQGLPA